MVLDDFVGIVCYGYVYLFMDEMLSCVVVDFCKCLYFVWNVIFDCDKIGDMDIELFKEFF